MFAALKSQMAALPALNGLPLTIPEELWSTIAPEQQQRCLNAQRVLSAFAGDRDLDLTDLAERLEAEPEDVLGGLHVLDAMALVTTEESNAGPRFHLRAMPDEHVFGLRIETLRQGIQVEIAIAGECGEHSLSVHAALLLLGFDLRPQLFRNGERQAIHGGQSSHLGLQCGKHGGQHKDAPRCVNAAGGRGPVRACLHAFRSGEESRLTPRTAEIAEGREEILV